MPHIERTIGDSKNYTRRSFIKGAVTIVVGAFLATGAGQLVTKAYTTAKRYITRRQDGLYGYDSEISLRTCHENPEIQTLYREYISPGKVLPAATPLSHRMLHTRYGKDIPARIKELETTPLSKKVADTKTYMNNL